MEEQLTQEQVLALVNTMPFPAATIGDVLWQYGYRFVLTESGWVSAPQE